MPLYNKINMSIFLIYKKLFGGENGKL